MGFGNIGNRSSIRVDQTIKVDSHQGLHLLPRGELWLLLLGAWLVPMTSAQTLVTTKAPSPVNCTAIDWRSLSNGCPCSQSKQCKSACCKDGVCETCHDLVGLLLGIVIAILLILCCARVLVKSNNKGDRAVAPTPQSRPVRGARSARRAQSQSVRGAQSPAPGCARPSLDSVASEPAAVSHNSVPPA